MVSDVFQWKNSSSKTSSVGMGTKLSVVNEDIQEDIVETRDYLQRLLRDDMLDKLEASITCYHNHFICGVDGKSISTKHREYIQGLTDDFYNRAKNDLLDKYIDDEAKIDAAMALDLQHKYCELLPQLNGVSGSTRNSFSQSVLVHTLHENSVARMAQLAQLRHDAITRETEAMQSAITLSNSAYNDAAEKDYQKFLAGFGLLKGSWNKIDYTDDTDRDFDRDIRDLTLSGQWNRTAGSIKDNAGDYDGQQDAIDNFGGGIGGIFGV